MSKTPIPEHNADGGSMMRLVVRLRSAVAHMAPHQKERENGKLIIDSLAAIEELDTLVKRCCDEWAEDHTHLQDLCRAAGCNDLEIDGDNYGVPGIIDLSNSLRDRLSSHNDPIHGPLQ